MLKCLLFHRTGHPDTPFEDSYVNLVHVNWKVFDCETRPINASKLGLNKGGDKE